MHMAKRCKEMNPVRVWCYKAESFMGRCRKLGISSNKASGNGLGMKTCNLILNKYSVGMHMAMQDLDMFKWGVM